MGLDAPSIAPALEQSWPLHHGPAAIVEIGSEVKTRRA
jgi:hypothetical protein